MTKVQYYSMFLKECRKASTNPDTERDPTLNDISLMTSIPLKTYHSWEMGRRHPQRDQLIELINLFFKWGGLTKCARIHQIPEHKLVDRVLIELGYAPIQAVATHPLERRIRAALYPADDNKPFEVSLSAKQLKTNPVIQPIQAARQYHNESVGVVGRDSELAELKTSWSRASLGQKQLVVVEGEAGIGKTSLVENFATCVIQQDAQVAWARCRAIHHGLPYDGMIQLLNLPLHDYLHQFDDIALNPLRQLLQVTDQHNLTGTLNEPRIRHQRFEAFVKLCQKVNKPLLLVFDDLQWCDNETIDCIAYLLQDAIALPLLVVIMFRTEDIETNQPISTSLLKLFNSGYMRDHSQRLRLEALSGKDAIQLASIKLKDGSQPQRINLISKCGGHPLLITEMLSEVATQGRANLFPTKIQSLIEHRIGALSIRARDLLYLITIFGSSVTIKFLQAVTGWNDDDITSLMDELWRKRLIRVTQIANFDIIYDLFREIIYQSVSPVLLPSLHKKIAQALAVTTKEQFAAMNGQLAYHYEQAGMIEDAITYYQLAATYARNLYVFEHQLRNLKRALQLLKSQPNNNALMAHELTIYGELIGPLIATKGYAAPDVINFCIKAEYLCRELGYGEIPLSILSGLSTYFMIRSEFSMATTQAEQLIKHAERQQQLVFAMDGRLIQGVIHTHTGRFQQATKFLQPDLEHDANYRNIADTAISPQNPMINRNGYYGVLRWYQGCPDSALSVAKEAVIAASQQESPYVKAMAIFTYVWVCFLRGDWHEVVRMSTEAIQMSASSGVDFWHAVNMRFLGSATAKLGNVNKGLEILQQGRQLYEQTGASMGHPLFICFGIEIYLATKQLTDAQKLIEELDAISVTTKEQFCESEIYRFKGIIALESGNLQLAEKWFRTAILHSQNPETKSLSLELRAVLSLCQLWRKQGKRTQAYKLLEEALAHFTEGFDTLDLREAHYYLKKLADSQGS